MGEEAGEESDDLTYHTSRHAEHTVARPAGSASIYTHGARAETLNSAAELLTACARFCICPFRTAATLPGAAPFYYGRGELRVRHRCDWDQGNCRGLVLTLFWIGYDTLSRVSAWNSAAGGSILIRGRGEECRPSLVCASGSVCRIRRRAERCTCMSAQTRRQRSRMGRAARGVNVVGESCGSWGWFTGQRGLTVSQICRRE